MPILTTFGAASFADVTFRRGSDGGVQERIRRYFYNVVDTTWATVGSWFTTVAHNVAAGALPTGGNDAIILSDCVADLDDPSWVVPGSIEITSNGGGDGYVLTLHTNASATFPKTVDIIGAGWLDLDGVSYA
jgi:hypothetical protein